MKKLLILPWRDIDIALVGTVTQTRDYHFNTIHWFLKNCANFRFHLIMAGNILMLLLRSQLSFYSTRWDTISNAAENPVYDTLFQGIFLCWLILWRRWRWRRSSCSKPTVTIPPVVGHHCKFLIPPSSPFLPTLHLSMMLSMLLTVPCSVLLPVPLCASSSILPELVSSVQNQTCYHPCPFIFQTPPVYWYNSPIPGTSTSTHQYFSCTPRPSCQASLRSLFLSDADAAPSTIEIDRLCHILSMWRSSNIRGLRYNLLQ